MRKLILLIAVLVILLEVHVIVGFEDEYSDDNNYDYDNQEPSQSLSNQQHRELRRHQRKKISTVFQHAENTDPHYVRTSHWWEVTDPFLNQFAGYNNQTMRLFLREYNFDNNVMHSCYQYRFEEPDAEAGKPPKVTMNSFCYPAIMITGVPKCSTSALYHMIIRFDYSRTLMDKEVCPLRFQSTNLHTFFDSLAVVPNDGSLNQREYIVSACIELYQNLILRKILRNPRTFYIVVVREYTDWLWSTYNYWCVEGHDPECDPTSHWVNKDLHRRSPELFHKLVTTARTKLIQPIVSPLDILYKFEVCSFAKKTFYNYVHELWQSAGVENTLILASEELERDPSSIIGKLVQAIGFSHLHFNVEEFHSVRYNTNSKV